MDDRTFLGCHGNRATSESRDSIVTDSKALLYRHGALHRLDAVTTEETK